MEQQNNNGDFSSTEVSEVKPENKFIKFGFILLIVLLGVFAGYQISKLTHKGSSTTIVNTEVPKSGAVKGMEFGVKDPKNADSTIGVVEKGGIDGEGTHKLLREGGPSQNVYINSSVLDLDQFVGQKIQVWGETNKAQKAGWFMDVIKVKILD